MLTDVKLGEEWSLGQYCHPGARAPIRQLRIAGKPKYLVMPHELLSMLLVDPKGMVGNLTRDSPGGMMSSRNWYGPILLHPDGSSCICSIPLRTRLLRVLSPKTILCRAFGLFEPQGLSARKSQNHSGSIFGLTLAEFKASFARTTRSQPPKDSHSSRGVWRFINSFG